MLRKATVQDAESIQFITATQLGYDAPLSLIEDQLLKLLLDEKNHYILVYENNETNKVLGYVHATLYEPLYAKSLFNILALAVRKESMGNGIGKALMQAVEEEAKKRHLSGVRLNSAVKRTEAHKFYEQIGYTSDKTQKRFMKMFGA